MPRWLSITLVVVVLLIVGIGGAYWWYLGDGSPPANLPAYSFDIAAVRAKADELPGGKASDIRVETVATADHPVGLSVAGEGFGNISMGAFSYQVILPTDTIIIDTAFAPKQAPSALFSNYDADAEARQFTERLALLLQASLLLRHGDQHAASAFIRTRLDGDWGRTYGTLPEGIDAARLVAMI